MNKCLKEAVIKVTTVDNNPVIMLGCDFFIYNIYLYIAKNKQKNWLCFLDPKMSLKVNCENIGVIIKGCYYVRVTLFMAQ